ncbi:MAG TPA: nitroreductase family protein [Candidatus Nanoarchaeia archaeon]|nr:nitroreductase family protein [Candidatus Nanoarchaeia archaeon]
MELDKVIKERISVRKYKKLEVPWYLVAECLDAATYAPSSGNVQNWRFVVVKDKTKREIVLKYCQEQYWALNAPVLIVVCSELDKIGKLFGVRGEALYAVQNCAAAIENLLLKAHEVGLGGVWIGDFDEMQLKDLLGISPEVRPQAVIALGFSDENEKKANRDPLDNVVYFEKYGEREDKGRKTIAPIIENLKKSFGFKKK